MVERASGVRSGRRDPVTALPHLPGTYVLLLGAEHRRRVPIGALGLLALAPGVYAYVGSARGPGGLAARVGTHRRVRARAPRWHVDSLGRHTSLREVWYAEDPVVFEHEWAELLASTPASTVPLRRFGASDCRCVAHLFHFDTVPSFSGFGRRARAALPGRAPVLRRWCPAP